MSSIFNLFRRKFVAGLEAISGHQACQEEVCVVSSPLSTTVPGVCALSSWILVMIMMCAHGFGWIL